MIRKLDESKIIELQKVIQEKKEKIKITQRQIISLKDRQRMNKLIKAGRVLEAAGLLDTFDYDLTLQVLLTHREECICQDRKK